MVRRNIVTHGFTTVISCVALKVASLLKVSFIVGSTAAFFSATSIAMPLIGLCGGALPATLLTLWGLIKGASSGAAAHYLAYSIPGFCASAYWFSNRFFVSLVLPLTCMLLFAAHPVGGHAVPYTLYWLIPVIIYCSKRDSIWLHALASTFIAHAVGSVIWIYTMPMAAQAWLGLIPVVAVERLVYASGSVAGYMCITMVKRMLVHLRALFVRTAADH